MAKRTTTKKPRAKDAVPLNPFTQDPFIKKVIDIYCTVMNRANDDIMSIIQPRDLAVAFQWGRVWPSGCCQNKAICLSLSLKGENAVACITAYGEAGLKKPTGPFKVTYVLHHFDGMIVPIYDNTGGTVWQEGTQHGPIGFIPKDFFEVRNANDPMAKLNKIEMSINRQLGALEKTVYNLNDHVADLVDEPTARPVIKGMPKGLPPGEYTVLYTGEGLEYIGPVDEPKPNLDGATYIAGLMGRPDDEDDNREAQADYDDKNPPPHENPSGV